MLTLGGVQDLFATSFQNELFERGDQLLTQCLYCTGLIFHELLLRTLKKKKKNSASWENSTDSRSGT